MTYSIDYRLTMWLRWIQADYDSPYTNRPWDDRGWEEWDRGGCWDEAICGFPNKADLPF